MCVTNANNDMERIYADALSAAKAFGKVQTDMVYGEGPAGAQLMLIGEAPGAEETRLSRPFVGRAGKNLDAFLQVLGLQRGEIFITNAVKFRPCKMSEKGRLSNRPPARDELAAMLPCLEREIETLRPRVVVTLGNVPLKCLMGARATIGDCHAKPAVATVLSHRFTLFPLYHPASVIYNRALEAVYMQDIEKLRAFLATL